MGTASKLKPDKLQRIELEIASYNKQTFTYDILLVLWKMIDTKQPNQVEHAQEIARAKKTRYFKGYRQFYAGNNTLIIPSVQKSWDKRVFFTTTEEELNTFFPDIQGRFLEKSKTVAEKNGRPDTSKEFKEMYELWGFREREKKI